MVVSNEAAIKNSSILSEKSSKISLGQAQTTSSLTTVVDTLTTELTF